MIIPWLEKYVVGIIIGSTASGISGVFFIAEPHTRFAAAFLIGAFITAYCWTKLVYKVAEIVDATRNYS